MNAILLQSLPPRQQMAHTAWASANGATQHYQFQFKRSAWAESVGFICISGEIGIGGLFRTLKWAISDSILFSHKGHNLMLFVAFSCLRFRYFVICHSHTCTDTPHRHWHWQAHWQLAPWVCTRLLVCIATPFALHWKNCQMQCSNYHQLIDKSHTNRMRTWLSSSIDVVPEPSCNFYFRRNLLLLHSMLANEQLP